MNTRISNQRAQFMFSTLMFSKQAVVQHPPAMPFQKIVMVNPASVHLIPRDGFPLLRLSHAALEIPLHPRLLLNMENDTIAPSVTFCYSCESLATILCSFCA